MAYVEKITVSYARTINLGDYNQIKFSVMPTVHLGVDDDVDAVLREVWASCRRNIEHAAAPIVKGYKMCETHGITEQELFLGIPIEDCRVTKEGNE